jgi:hypothetical protein
MIGNAVPVDFSKSLAIQIKNDMKQLDNYSLSFNQRGKLLNN